MEEIVDVAPLPDGLRRILSFALTVLAALLYAVVLGSAVVRAWLDPDATFTEGTVRTASLLSGLVGSVVSSGFARGSRPSAASVSIAHPLGGRARTGWQTLRRPSLVRCKLLGLAGILGLRATALTGQAPAEAPAGEAPDTPAELDPGRGYTASLWVALLYFALYFVIGAGAFLLNLMQPATPEFLGNAAWVWLGTVMSSGYSFFALGPNVHVGVMGGARRRALRI